MLSHALFIYSAPAGSGIYIRIPKAPAISAFIDDALAEALPCDGPSPVVVDGMLPVEDHYHYH